MARRKLHHRVSFPRLLNMNAYTSRDRAEITPICGGGDAEVPGGTGGPERAGNGSGAGGAERAGGGGGTGAERA